MPANVPERQRTPAPRPEKNWPAGLAQAVGSAALTSIDEHFSGDFYDFVTSRAREPCSESGQGSTQRRRSPRKHRRTEELQKTEFYVRII